MYTPRNLLDLVSEIPQLSILRLLLSTNRFSLNVLDWVFYRFRESLLTLTHLPLVPHICVNEAGQHWFKQWLVAYSAPCHYLNQCWAIINWTLGNKIKWNSSQNTKLVIHENALENVVFETAAILSIGSREIQKKFLETNFQTNWTEWWQQQLSSYECLNGPQGW